MSINVVKKTERDVLEVICQRHGAVRLSSISSQWVVSWIQDMKRIRIMAPSTIRHHVGALRRCFAWLVRVHPQALPHNPLSDLPKGYAAYNGEDVLAVGMQGRVAPVDGERDRRLGPAEESRIRAILALAPSGSTGRPLVLEFHGALECIFDLALESAMRMREMFTLSREQVDLERRTIFLEKTKNGDKRQVPVTTVAMKSLRQYIHQVSRGERGMRGFALASGQFFPWWDGDTSDEALDRTTSLLSAQFARIFDAAGCADLRFHDLRHEATSRLFERTTLTEVEISKITGHKDPRMLRRYANLRGSTLANKLW